jgi:hypothetical protein
MATSGCGGFRSTWHVITRSPTGLGRNPAVQPKPVPPHEEKGKISRPITELAMIITLLRPLDCLEQNAKFNLPPSTRVLCISPPLVRMLFSTPATQVRSNVIFCAADIVLASHKTPENTSILEFEVRKCREASTAGVIRSKGCHH